MTDEIKKIDDEKEKPSPKIKLVKMVRESDGVTADVHPDEVENYTKGDFKVL